MELLIAVSCFALGFGCCASWGNHRAKYWHKKYDTLVGKCNDLIEKGNDLRDANTSAIIEIAHLRNKCDAKSVDDGEFSGLSDAVNSMGGKFDA